MSRAFPLSLLVACLLVSSCETLNPELATSVLKQFTGNQELNLETITAGLREALQVSTRNSVAQTSKDGGFQDNPLIRIPMPEKLDKLGGALRTIGLGSVVDDFERRMNVAAEQAAAKATPVFIDGIKQMSFADAKAILKGNETAATDYFRRVGQDRLQEVFRPIATAQMEQVGAVSAYNKLLTAYRKLPFSTEPQFSLEEYVTGKSIDGLFHVLAEEEKKIRKDPAARTSALLRQVFGSQQ
ncbi:MAG: hypothetical protein ACI8W8_003471 [Rhodothermales bacterium]|jgi:hypothetical protein